MNGLIQWAVVAAGLSIGHPAPVDAHGGNVNLVHGCIKNNGGALGGCAMTRRTETPEQAARRLSASAIGDGYIHPP
jgi:hypothetical protein